MAFDPDQYKTTTRQQWEDAAEAWHRWGPTLEDWLDPARLRDDYVPTGYRGYDGKTRSVKGHPFGLDLPEADRRALIAFLKTL